LIKRCNQIQTYNIYFQLNNPSNNEIRLIVGLLIDEFRTYQTKRIEAQGTETLFCYVKDGKINNINYIIKIHLHKIKSELWILNDRECVSNSARHSMRDMPRVLKTPIKLQHSILRNRDQRVPEKYGDSATRIYSYKLKS